jgi:hypothetical protein
MWSEVLIQSLNETKQGAGKKEGAACLAYFSALKMEAAGYCETTWR